MSKVIDKAFKQATKKLEKAGEDMDIAGAWDFDQKIIQIHL